MKITKGKLIKRIVIIFICAVILCGSCSMGMSFRSKIELSV